MNPILRLAIFFSILVAGFLAIGTYWAYNQAQPTLSQSVSGISQLTNSVEIYRDENGITSIDATNLKDAYFALGYAQAQDRRWQLFMLQLCAEGRFSEYFGSRFLDLDKHLHQIGIWQSAQKSVLTLPAEQKEILQAYTDGINTYTKQNPRQLNESFAITQLQPLEWNIAHSLASFRLYEWELNQSWWADIIKEVLNQNLSEPINTALGIPFSNPLDSTFTKSSVEQLLHFLKLEQNKRALLHQNNGYNKSTAVAFRGGKIVSSIHDVLNLPNRWYAYKLRAKKEEIELNGVAIVGFPYLLHGHNNDVSWSILNNDADHTQFFALSEADENHYFIDGEKKAYQYQTVVIPTKDQGDVLYELKLSDFGHITHNFTLESSKQSLALNWIGMNASDDATALFEINIATNLDTFTSALKKLKSHSFTALYSDKLDKVVKIESEMPNSNTSFMMAKNSSQILKEVSNNYSVSDYSTIDYQLSTPFDSKHLLIQSEVLEKHYTAYKNQLNEIIKNIRSAPSNEDLIALQTNIYSPHAQQLTASILPILKKNNVNQEFDAAIAYLDNWNFEYDKNATAASILESFQLIAVQNILQDNIGSELYKELQSYPPLFNAISTHLLLSENNKLFDDINTNEIETKTDIIVESMSQTLNQLAARLGGETRDWRWGNVHTLIVKEPILHTLKDSAISPFDTDQILLNSYFSIGNDAVDGGLYSFSSMQYSIKSPFDLYTGPAVRFISNLSSDEHTLFNMTGGQSEHPLSPFYDNLHQGWLENTYIGFTPFQELNTSTYISLTP